MRTSLALALTLFTAAAALPGSANADGLPVPVEDTGPTGIADSSGLYRYISLPDGPDTFVARTVQNGGAISAWTSVAGDYTIPAVGVDGSPSGLSADGRTLVLIRPRPSFPRKTTEFAVLDAERVKLRERISLDGDFSFDAISPDGSKIYLIHYLSRRDYTQYEVRAYDLARGKLVGGAIVDPNESNEEMYGIPASRVSSPSGRWAYTLYLGNEHPFVHALDTERGAAVCIDLDALAGVRDPGALRLEAGAEPGTLIVTRRGEPAALVDTESFEVSPPPAAEPSGPAISDPSGPGWAIWAMVGGGLAVLLAAGAMTIKRRQIEPVR